MGRTIQSATQTWVEEDAALRRFVRALRKSDQVLIDELIALSHSHVAEASYASNLYPMDIYLVSMLLELYKKVKQLELKLEQNGVLPVAEVNPSRGLVSLLELVNQEEDTPAEEQASAPLEDDEEAPAEYVDLQEGA
ncbi:MAG: hypothetical protein CVU43_14085 [Chloroflexi bacterium HGW-Chloroflexi-5]|jgi:hypothetical protein|nr:MAG: hypothetical protein CVU43_14085 [Chloroflexi bacterium HGW-Chloroflexi-5]